MHKSVSYFIAGINKKGGRGMKNLKKAAKSDDELKKIELVQKSKYEKQLVITVTYSKNRTWGYCPKAEDNFGNESPRITGCGYCKLSTATADVLNKNLFILKKLYEKKDKNIKKRNHDILGYGSGYGLLPSFEGGVGINSHLFILEKFFKVSYFEGKNSHVLIVDKK
jgi:hypothetical protein